MGDLTQGVKLYAIDDWHQLLNARSNSDPTLRIKITDFFNSDILEGVRISVHHPQYGILFATVQLSAGRLVNYDLSSRLTPEQVLTALKQFGFDIRFNSNPRLNKETIAFLTGAKAAGYTHVRWAIKKHSGNKYSTVGNCVYTGCVQNHQRVVLCFNENKRPEFLSQYIKPIKNFGGDVMVVSPNNNPNLDFSWLTFPMYIDSVLTDNL